jgi:hypothetical protein
MTEAMDVSPGMQAAWLFLLALPIACIAWTVTHEDLFREVRDYCVRRSEEDRRWYVRKFFYVFTCEYCFSHYVALGFLAMTGYKLLLGDWRGFVIGGFALVWIANIYMSVFARLRLVIKSERVDIKLKEGELQKEGEPREP